VSKTMVSLGLILGLTCSSFGTCLAQSNSKFIPVLKETHKVSRQLIQTGGFSVSCYAGRQANL
jgi:hypothetical protein